MMKTDDFLPEGSYGTLPSVRQALHSLEGLRRAQDEGRILEAPALRCTAAHDRLFDVGFARGVMPRACCALGIAEGQVREIAVLSCVGRGVCCRVTGQRTAPNGDTELLLSRRLAQEEAMDYIEAHAEPGLVIPAQITHLAPFGAFADIGCGVVALLPLASISTAHIRHPRERFAMGQRIFAVVQEIDRAARRITLSHKELLGTWLENAADFRPGDTVTGILRGKHPYGQFVELTPNLSGLTDTPQALPEGSAVSVRIRSIQPERQKIRLQVIRVLGPAAFPTPLPYRITGGSVRGWRYTQEPPLISSQ